MDREVVVSTSIRAVGYDVDTSVLEIEFCDSSVYQFFDVPAEIHEGVINSLGLDHGKTDLEYFNENIKGKYQQKTIRRPRLNLFKGILET